jgi:hypothetical protein
MDLQFALVIILMAKDATTILAKKTLICGV